MSPVVIRRFCTDDLTGLVALEQQLESGWSSRGVVAEVDRTGGVLLVAVAGCSGLVIGWCCGLLAEEEAELLRIAVTPLKRECGVASALLSAFESECRDKKVAVIFLEVADMNCPARRLYAKFAYQQVGKRKDYYRQPPDDALVMNKRLQV